MAYYRSEFAFHLKEAYFLQLINENEIISCLSLSFKGNECSQK